MVYKNFQTIDDLDLKGKRVFLIIDINSEIINGKPSISARIKEHAKTISLLKKKKAKVIVTSYQGRPGKKDLISLRNHAKLLNKFVKIKFVPKFIGRMVEKSIRKLKEGEAILLENRRFEKDEYSPKKNNKIYLFFKDKFDIYINDAFSISHRNETSITQLPRGKIKAIGKVMENEIKNIEKIKNNLNGALFILGGVKFEDIRLLIKRNKILPTGILALLVLKAKGYNLGKKEEKVLNDQFKNLNFIKKHINLFEIPEDMAYEYKGKRIDYEASRFPDNSIALDIGKKTIEKYEEIISKSKKILMKGTAGECSKKNFCIGTVRILKALEKSKGFCVVSGGHTQTAIEKNKINKNKIGYVSLSGGALIHYLAGKKLPGLEALKEHD